jgi:hypothetical protein
MGVGALFLQQFAHFAVGAVLRGISPAQQFAHLSTLAGLIYVALLVAFVAMPVLANWSQSQSADAPSKQTALLVVKIIHTFTWAFFVSCILAIPILAWRGWFGGVLVPMIFVFIEIGILITNEWRCPLTNVAAHYTDDRSDNFDIYLPPWLARRKQANFWLAVRRSSSIRTCALGRVDFIQEVTAIPRAQRGVVRSTRCAECWPEAEVGLRSTPADPLRKQHAC